MSGPTKYYQPVISRLPNVNYTILGHTDVLGEQKEPADFQRVSVVLGTIEMSIFQYFAVSFFIRNYRNNNFLR